MLEVRNGNGAPYLPDTSYQLVMCLQKAVNFDRKRKDIFLDSYKLPQFRYVLDGKIKRPHRAGYGQLKWQAHALTEMGEEKLWPTHVLGEENPKQLLDTVFFSLLR